MTSMTRGSLPPGVYWRRRVMVFGTAVLLVIAFAHMLGGGGSPQSQRAVNTAADQKPSAGDSPSDTARPRGHRGHRFGNATSADRESAESGPPASQAPVLTPPVGKCDDSDVAVTPEAPEATAGRLVRIILDLRTLENPACTWVVSARTLTLKITSGHDDIWFSHDCPQSIPKKSVVVRNNATSRVVALWNARRSDGRCSSRTEWALPGSYHVAASSLAGEPSEVQFELAAPTPRTITRTRQPDPKNTPKGQTDPKDGTNGAPPG